MKKIEIIEKSELKELLLDGAGLITDEITHIWEEAQKQYKLHGDLPDEEDERWSKYIDQKKGVWTNLDKMKEFDKECEKHLEKTKELDFEDKMEKRIMKVIYKFIIKQEL